MTHFDVYGIGNALLDTEYEVTNNFLVSHGFVKGRRHPIDFDGKQQLLTTIASLPSRSSLAAPSPTRFTRHKALIQCTFLV